MIKLVVGTKGSGKTKTIIEQINHAAKTTSGNVVVIEKSMKLTYDIVHKARLIDVDEYNITGGEMFYGFVCGVLAGNYDITELYIDGILKIVGRDFEKLAQLLDAIELKAGDAVKVTVTVSASEEELPDSVKKHL